MTKSFRDCKKINRAFRLLKQNQSNHSSNPYRADRPYRADKPSYSDTMTRIMQANRLARAPMLVGSSATAHLATAHLSTSSPGAGRQLRSSRRTSLDSPRPTSHTAFTLSVSAAALSLSLASGAQAQDTIPAECTPNSLVAGGTLTCVSTTPITEAITTIVDGITIIIGDSGTPTSITTSGSGNAITALIADGETGDININSEFGILSGLRGIYAQNAGTGSVRITAAEVTGTDSHGIDAQLTNSNATGDLSITASGAVSGGAVGIRATNAGTGAITIISSDSVTGRAGDGISATTAGRNISISGAHTVSGSTRGIFADSNGGNISIQGVGLTGGVQGSAGHGIYADATRGSNGNINIGDTTAIGDVSGIGTGSSGIFARTGGTGRSITIDASGGSVSGSSFGNAISADNLGFGASSISITTADAIATSTGSAGIFADINNTQSTGTLIIDSSAGAVMGGETGISVRNRGRGATDITVGDVSASGGTGIFARTTLGVNITVNAGGMVSGSSRSNAIQTGVISGDMNLPADRVTIMGSVTGNIRTLRGADTVILAAGSITTGISIDLGEGEDTLDLASTAFGMLDGGPGADTLSVSGTGITLVTSGASAVSGFETFAFTAGSNTLRGTHAGIASSTIATGAMLDLAAGSSLSGDLANSGMLTVAGAGIGSATITGNLVLNSGGTLSLNTLTDGTFDQIVVGEAVSVGGTLALGQQTTMPSGTVVLIDGASLSGTFASTTGLVTGLLISQAIAYDGPSGQVQLVTSARMIDSAFPTGCAVTPTSPLADGGTLTCISATPITDPIATTVDGVTIIIGESDTPTTVMTASGDAITASIADGGTGDIRINSEFGIISGGANGIVASSAGTGGISITTAAVTGGESASGISAQISDAGATGALMIDSSAGAVMGGNHGISAENTGTGGISITTAAVTGTNSHGITANLRNINATSNIDITATGAVMGGGFSAISAINDGTGGISITAAAVTGTGTSSSGIAASFTNSATASDISITATGAVMGEQFGIGATNTGTGGISITTAAVTGMSVDGISANLRNSNAIGNLSITASGAVSGGEDGIYARQDGNGTVTIDASMSGAIGGTGNAGILVTSAGSGAISVMNAGTGGSGSRAISIASTGAVSGAAGGIAATHTGDGAITITSSNSVTGNGGDAISANSAGGAITISGAHTVRGRRGIYADSDGGDISIQGAGATGGVTSTGTHGIQADARGGSGGNINIGGTTAIGAVSSATGTNIFGVYAHTSGTDSTVTIDTSGGAIISHSQSIRVLNSGAGASSISVTAASASTMAALAINTRLDNSAATGDISVTTTGAIAARFASAISVLNAGSGTATITIASGLVTAYAGMGIVTQTVAGANIIVTAGSMISTSAAAAIQTSRPTGDSTSTPADTVDIRGTVRSEVPAGGNILTTQGDDTVTLAAGSMTMDITIDLGEDDDTLNLASTTFGTLDGGAGADTLNVSGTGITLTEGAHSNFETLVFTAGSNTLSGTHTDLASSRIDSGATLDLAAGSSLSGGLTNSGMLTVAGAGFGSVTIGDGLRLNSGGTLSLDTNGAGGETDLLMVSGAVTLGGTLALTQTTMPSGTVVLIDGASLSGTFASTTGLIDAPLISQAIAYDGPNGQVRLITTVLELDPAFPTGCTVTPETPLADGGTLTCISADTITESIATTVDGVTIVIGESGTLTTVMTASGDALSASIADTSAAGNISINTEFGTISGAGSGIVASTAGTGSITITSGSVTGTGGDGISANSAGGDISISGAHTVLGTGGRGIEAISVGGDISVQGVGATDGVTGTTGSGIHADATGGTGGNINIGDMTALGDVTGGGSSNSGINAQTDGLDSSITIDSSGGAVMSDGAGISATNAGTGVSAITITAAAVTGGESASGISASLSDAGATGAIMIDSSAGAVMGGMNGISASNAGTGGISIMSATTTGMTGDGISAQLTNSAAVGDISITASGTVMSENSSIFAVNAGSGMTTITVASVSTGTGIGIFTRTIAGATLVVNAEGTLSGAVGNAAIRTDAPDGVSATPADSVTIRGTVSRGNIETLAGADIVSLALTSVTTDITIDLGEGDDSLYLSSVNFGTLDGGPDTDTLNVAGVGITLEGGRHSNFERLIFEAGSNTLSGTHTGLMSSSIATGATLDLAAGSSLSGDLANSGMLTVAGAGFGSATISGGLTLNAEGSVSLDTNGAGGETDLLTVIGAVSVSGTLALTQTTMPDGTVVLIDGASLTGTFASTTGLVTGLLISQAIAYDGPSGEVRLVTIVTTPDPTGCVSTPTSPLADGGTLTCISATPLTEAIATSVDGVTIIIGDSGTPTRVTTSGSDAAINASIANVGTGDITINSVFGTIFGEDDGISAVNAGTGGVSITTADVTGNNGRGIDTRISDSVATGDIMINSSGGTITGKYIGISATNYGTGGISINAAAASASAYHGISAWGRNSNATSDISITATGTVMGGSMSGIRALNDGTGGIRITAAAVTGSSTTSSGINARLNNSSATGDLSITASGAVSGGGVGILAQQDGSGTLTIDASAAGAIGGSGQDDAGIRVMSAATGAISVMNAGTGGSGSRAISIASTGVVSSAAGGIAATHSGDGAITITGGSVTGNAGDGISANSAGGDISISGAHTVLGTGGRGIFADSDGGDISIQGVGATGGVTGSAGHGIFADATGGTGGNINIGDITAIGAITGTGNGNRGIYAFTNGAGRSITIDASGGTLMSNGTSSFAISVANAGTGASSISITTADVTAPSAGGIGIFANLSATGATGALMIDSSAGAVMAGGAGIIATNAGSGSVTITGGSVTAQSGNAIRATTAGGDISISGAHTVLGTGGRGIEATSGGGDISIHGVGATGGVQGTAGHGIYADATGGSGGNINIGDMTALGAITGTGSGNSGIFAQTDGVGRSITIDSAGGAVMGDGSGISAINAGTEASSISITSAAVTGTNANGIDAQISDAGATGAIMIDSSAGVVMGGVNGISVLNEGSGTTTITVSDISASGGIGILTSTTIGAIIIIDTGGRVSGGGMNAIETNNISERVGNRPADTVTIRGTVTGGNISTRGGSDTVTLAAESTTTGIAVILGSGNDSLDLASSAFGTLNGGAGEDTLSVSGTGITLDGGGHSNFEMLAFTAGSNTLSGPHTGLMSSSIATGAMLDLAAGSSLSGDLANSGMLTVAGSGFGSATISGRLDAECGWNL